MEKETGGLSDIPETGPEIAFHPGYVPRCLGNAEKLCGVFFPVIFRICTDIRTRRCISGTGDTELCRCGTVEKALRTGPTKR